MRYLRVAFGQELFDKACNGLNEPIIRDILLILIILAGEEIPALLPVMTGRMCCTSAVLPTPGSPAIRSVSDGPWLTPVVGLQDGVALLFPTIQFFHALEFTRIIILPQGKTGHRAGGFELLLHALQIRVHPKRGLVAIVRILFQQFQDDGGEDLRKLRVDALQRRGRFWRDGNE